MGQLVKNPSTMWETWVWSLGWETLLEKGMATHSSILARRIPWVVQSVGSQRVGPDWACRPRCQSVNTSPQLLLSALVPGALVRFLHTLSRSVPGEASCHWCYYCPHRTEEETTALMAECLLRAIPRLSHDGDQVLASALFTFCHLYTPSWK